MRLSDITLMENMKTDFYDMYLLSSVQHSDDPDVRALLTDRVDKLIDHFRLTLYQAFMLRLDAVLDDDRVYGTLNKVDDPQEMIMIIKDIANNGDICPEIMGKYPVYLDSAGPGYAGKPMPYGTFAIGDGNWLPIVRVFLKLCDPPNSVNLKIMLLDKLFGLAHNGGSLTDYLDPNSSWLFDALYTRALAHPNELAKYASHDARQAAKSANIGHGLGSSLSSYKSVTGADKLNLFRAKQERGAAPRPDYNPSPHWLPDE